MKKSSIFSAYIELTKPQILRLVLVITTLGYYLGGKGINSYLELFFLLLGSGMVCGGSSVINHYMEREFDSKMLRTQKRPIPSGIISPENALKFGITLSLIGIFILYVKINILTAFLSLLTSFLYIMVYTPLKRVSWLNTSVGAIPGAIPTLGGWAAATGTLNFTAGILFLILFLWQHPHFYAIAWMFKDDYKRGGFKMLPVVEPDGRRTFEQIIITSILLIPISLIPAFIGLSGKIYFTGALISGIALLWVGYSFTRTKTHNDARKLLRATVAYLPFLLLLIVIDTNF